MVVLPLRDVSRFHSSEVKKHAGSVDAYRGILSSDIHLLPECIGGTLQPVNFFDVLSRNSCKVCKDTPAARMIDTSWSMLGNLQAALYHLDEAAECYEQLSDSLEHVSNSILAETFTRVKRHAPSFADKLQSNPLLSDLTYFCKEKAATLNEKLVAYLRSDTGKRLLIKNLEDVHDTWQENKSHILVSGDGLYDDAMLIVAAYGTLIAPDVHLVFAPNKLLSLLRTHSLSSMVYIEEDTENEVIRTMGILWEPDSHTVLGDAGNALIAAQMLTLKVVV